MVSVLHIQLSVIARTMPIFQAIGFGILIIVLKVLIPNVLSEAEKTAVVFLQGAQVSGTTATAMVGSVGVSPNTPALPPFKLPRASQITPMQE